MRIFNTFVLLFFAVLAIASCSSGPSSDLLQTRVQEILDSRIAKDTFKIKKFSRRGSYSFSKEGPRLIVYYKADIEFLKSHVMGNWNQPGKGSFQSLLGAQAAGIKGVVSEGNQKGDVLTVYGTLGFKQNGNEWEYAEALLEDSGGADRVYDPKKRKPEIDSAHPGLNREQNPFAKEIEELNEISQFLLTQNPKKYSHDLHELFRESINDLKLRVGKVRNWHLVATGPSTGVYYALGRALEGLAISPDSLYLETTGSLENIEYLRNKRVDFALVQSDVAQDAFIGKGVFENKKAFVSIRAITALYPEAIHLLAKTELKVKKLSDLKGKKVNLGPPGSGTYSNASEILSLSKWTPNDRKAIMKHSMAWVLEHSKDKEVDALFYTGAIPTVSLSKLMRSGEYELISLEKELTTPLIRAGGFIPLEIAAHSYPNQKRGVATLGVTALLVTHQSVSKKRIDYVLNTVFSNLDLLERAASQASYISKDQYRTGVSIPFHPVAERWFKAHSP